MTDATPPTYRWLLLAVLLPALVYWLHGFDGSLTRDDALNIYMAQQWVDHGILPFQSVFIHQGPGSTFFNAAAMVAGRAIGITDDIHATRVTSWLLLSMAHIPLFLLLFHITRSKASALFGLLAFTSFWGFGVHVISGPNTKSWSTMLMVLQFWLIVERRWLLAALAGSLSAWVWQPMIGLAGAGFLLCVLASMQHKQWRAPLAYIAGSLLPWLLCSVYFYKHNALWDMWDGMVLFNIDYVSTLVDPWDRRVLRFKNAMLGGYKWAVVLLATGIIAGLASSLKQLLVPAKDGNRIVPLLFLSIVLPVIWTWLDFQSYPDFYVFLPYAAIGCALLANTLPNRTIIHSASALLVVLASASYASPWMNLWIKGKDILPTQQQFAHALPLSDNDTLLSFGDTTPLVILKRSNPNRHIQINSFLLRHIDARYPGGLDGWLSDIETLKPKVILDAYGNNGLDIPRLQDFLATHYRSQNHSGLWVYTRLDTP